MAVKQPRGGSKSERGGGSKPPPKKRWSLRRRIVVAMLGVAFLGLFVLSMMYLLVKIPLPTQVATAQSTVVLDYLKRPLGRG